MTAAYEAHLISSANLDYRRGVAPALAPPYEDRLHNARGEQTWPGAGVGDVVVIMQIDIQPPRLDEALSLVEALAAGPRAVLVDPGQMRTRMRAEAFPGEDPDTLPQPDEIGPMIVAYAGAAELGLPIEAARFSEWKAARMPTSGVRLLCS